MEPADFYGAGFTALRRQLGWLQHADALPHPEEERLSRAIGYAPSPPP